MVAQSRCSLGDVVPVNRHSGYSVWLMFCSVVCEWKLIWLKVTNVPGESVFISFCILAILHAELAFFLHTYLPFTCIFGFHMNRDKVHGSVRFFMEWSVRFSWNESLLAASSENWQVFFGDICKTSSENLCLGGSTPEALIIKEVWTGVVRLK